ncbi:ricin B lectin domain-containing protein [Schizophyllum amplum]|uniref:Ricin B lectin domain-containing protein n=1 Tax=Schizophyllum amplum TaxID=97359 RepID=A0A550C9S7_9AGAR|nr:ricin B lectin domain-containing protein [Auriculariopsis ampla]
MFTLSILALLPAVLATPVARQTSSTSSVVYVHPNGDTNFCLGAAGSANGALVDIFDCSTKNTNTPSWVLDNTTKRFQLNGTMMCLDAGNNPANGVTMKIWQCYDGLNQQLWSYDNNEHFSVGNGAQALDLRDGYVADGANTQTWAYSADNTNQRWSITSTGGSTTTPTTPPVTSSGQTLHPNGNTGKCLDVQGNVQENGTPVDVYDCNGTSAQNWVLNRGSTHVRLAGTDLCLDAGSNIGNGMQMKLWQCYDGLAQQTWYWTDDNRIAVQGYGQCLDLTSGVSSNGNIVQSWTCTDGNTNQIWS